MRLKSTRTTVRSPGSCDQASLDIGEPADRLSLTPRREPPARILFVDNQVGDFLQYRMEFALALKQAGFEVHVALPREPGLDKIHGSGIAVHVIQLKRLSTLPMGEFFCWLSLCRLYRSLRPKLVHHICFKPTLYGGIAARVADVPGVVSTLTGLGYLFSADSFKMRFLRAIAVRGLRVSFGHPNHRVIFQNPDDRDCLLSTSRLPFSRAVLIKGSGVDPSVFTHEPEPDGPPMVLMASRLLWAKGVGDFVTAAQVLRARGIDARFMLLGEPDRGHPSAIPLETLKKWRDDGDIRWPGWRNDMPVAIAESHIVCLPSRYGEGVPRILLEAASSGRPIVSTDTPGCREVVRHGENGLLVKPGDGEGLARALSILIEDRSLRRVMGTRGREIAIREFSVEQVIDANLEVYRSLCVLPGI